jgi:hypothetical protein
MTKRYEVLTHTEVDGWVNCWSLDGWIKETFASIEEAEADITEYILDCQDAVARGDMEDAPSREDFMIVEEGERP